MSTPKRIQMSRQKPWREDNPDAVIVARPGKWGNPFAYRARMGGLVRYCPANPGEYEFEGRISADGMRHDYFHPDGNVTHFEVRWATRHEIVELFRRTLLAPDGGMLGASPSRQGRFSDVTVEDIRRELASKDLACWCKPSQPCHADVLLELANGGDS